ncbi:putative vegetative incompatibility protein HET-E-1 [Triangularia setosa]|uniref:Vegetative incompatibility protein HET-E-1 n=1 Tax=Triangularia setosa TaxID=2587417 RepID=A0AAN6VZ73_9PEZI|nr:putative vegetative incompatibility protein HET-E-1 [Podospora setosa]
MRLLNTTTLEFELFLNDVPQYAILSHTWGEQEVTFNDMSSPARISLKGWQKVQRCCRLARLEGWGYVWIDTCCINKADSSELGEAINSMFRWYEEAQVCYAFLEDVSPCYRSDGKSRPSNSELAGSRWFTRGWTLQELLAPPFLAFLDSSWNIVGSRETRALAVTYATKMQQKDIQNFRTCSVATKLSWASARQTTRLEDRAYSLMGLLGVHMPLIYGEGRNAFVRLQHELIRLFNDETVLLWTTNQATPFCNDPQLLVAEHLEARGRYPGWLVRQGLFAESVKDFSESNGLVVRQFDKIPRNFRISNAGISLDVELFQRFEDEDSKYQQWHSGSRSPALYAIKLNCARISEPNEPMVLPLAGMKAGHPVYEVLRSSCLQTSQQFMRNTRRLRGKWQSLGRHNIILASPNHIAFTSSSNTLISVHVGENSPLPSLSLGRCFGYRPLKDGGQQWSLVKPNTISNTSSYNDRDQAGLGFATIQHFGVITLKDGGALMTHGTLHLGTFSVIRANFQPTFYVLLVYLWPPFPRFGIWHVGKTPPGPERFLDLLNQRPDGPGCELPPNLEEATLGPEQLVKYLNKNDHSTLDFEFDVEYPHTASLGDDLVVQVEAKPIPFFINDSLHQENESFNDVDLSEETEASHWLRQASRDELEISKHVQFKILVVEKDLLTNDDPEEHEWDSSMTDNYDLSDSEY